MTGQYSYSEATLADLADDLWRGRLYLLRGLLAGLLAALIFLGLAVPHYRAVMIIGPVLEQKENLEIPLVDPLAFERFESILRGPRVAARVKDQEEIAQGLMAARRWRAGRGADFSAPEKLASYLQKKIQIAPVGNTTLRRVTYDHPDPDFAARMLAALYQAADNIIHEESRALATQRTAHLQDALAQTQNPDHRRALTAALMAQEQLRILLALDEPYAAFMVEPPMALVRPWWPRSSLVLTAFMALGLFAGFAFHSLRHAGRAV